MKLALVQPSLRREWQLVRGDEVLATLWIQLFRRGGAAEIEGHRLKIEREGGLRSAYAIRHEETGEQLARVVPQGPNRVLELGDRTVAWKHLGLGKGHGFVGSDGEPLLHAKVSSGIMRTNGEGRGRRRPPRAGRARRCGRRLLPADSEVRGRRLGSGRIGRCGRLATATLEQ